MKCTELYQKGTVAIAAALLWSSALLAQNVSNLNNTTTNLSAGERKPARENRVSSNVETTLFDRAWYKKPGERGCAPKSQVQKSNPDALKGTQNSISREQSKAFAPANSGYSMKLSGPSILGCNNVIGDGGFEAGPGGGPWTEASTNFGTPICDLGLCGNGTGTGPRTGTYWAWFGGFGGGTETGSVSQTVVFPAGDSITLKFYLEQIICDSPSDFLEVTVDGTQVFLTDGSSTLCGQLGYTLQTVNLSAYADGNPHTIVFNSTTSSVNGGVTNFFVDDIELESCPPGGGGPVCQDTVAFTGVNLAIPDDDPAGVTDVRAVAGVSGTTLGNDVKLSAVCFSITHTWVGDLIVSLTAPNGTTVTLTDQPGVPATLAGCSGDNMDVCVILGTGNEMENVCNNLPAISGNFTAAGGANLNAVNTAGGSPNGNWELFISDNAGFDTGVLVEWSLLFDVGPIANWNNPGTICATSAPINLNTLVTGTTGGTWTGTGVTGSNFNPSGLSGPVDITYTVTDIGTGCSDSETNTITVVPGPPSASFSFTPVSLNVNFTNTTTGTGTYLWDFGDGNTSTATNPSHTYAAAGTYTVTLTATNICGSNVATQSVTVQGCPDVIIDGGFEVGGTWIEFSSTFGTPVCDLPSCGNGTGTGPRTGSFWSWFGGIAAFEEGSMTQTVTIANNSTATLNFWLEQIVCDSPSDFLKVAVDGDTLFTTTGASTLCGQLGYSLQTVSLNAYADGNPHTISFFSRIYGLNGNGTNFFVDDVSLIVCPGIGFPENNLNQAIDLMPIPARDFVDVHIKDLVSTKVTIEVSDLIGKNVYSTSVMNINGNKSERIDVSNWNKGIYLVKVSDSGHSVVRKIVVQ
jgi:PKD repeat protein/subtilisin-like proprotein convertase family protein